MTLSVPRQKFKALEKALLLLEDNFLRVHLAAPPALTISVEETLAASAYAVFSHAALEGFFEDVTHWVLDQAVSHWTAGKRISQATGCLLLSVNLSKNNEGRSVFDQIRLSLDDAKTTLSRLIKKDNHGISEKHLRSLFNPVGIDLPANPSMLSSLNRLAKDRGQRAHNSIGAATLLSASDAKKLVEDCRQIAEAVVLSAVALKP